MADKWLPFTEAVTIARARLNASVGHTQVQLRAAIKAGEIRKQDPPVLFTADDGLLGGIEFPSLRPDIAVERADFEYWLGKIAPPTADAPAEQFPEDAALIEEGLAMRGTDRKIAKALASRAKGASPEAIIDRLRHKIAAERKRRQNL